MSVGLTFCPLHRTYGCDDDGSRTVAVTTNLLIMMHNSQTVRSERNTWALSQQELADLLSISRTALTRLEVETESTSLETAIGLVIVFGLGLDALLPHTYAQIEDAVMKRGAVLDRRLRWKTDEKSLRKLKLLEQMVKRASVRTSHI